MKSKLLSLFILVLSITGLKSQIISPRFGFGFTTIATSGGVQKTSVSSAFKIHLGAQLEYPFMENLHGVTGLIFEGKGAKETRKDNGFDAELKYNPVYLIIPAGVKYFIESDNMQFFVNGGFFTGIGLWGKAKQSGDYMGRSLDEEVNFFSVDGMNRLEFGIDLGGGIKIPINDREFEFGILLSFSLTNIGDAKVLNVTTAKNQAFKVYAALPLTDIINF